MDLSQLLIMVAVAGTKRNLGGGCVTYVLGDTERDVKWHNICYYRADVWDYNMLALVLS